MIQLKTMVLLCFVRETVLFAFFIMMLALAHTAHGQQASFTANVTQGCGSLNVQFKSTASGNTHWSWKFGNGNTSIGSGAINKEPGATYNAPGVYDVELTVTTSSGSTVTERKNGFIVVHAKPTVNFSFDDSEGCSPLTVNFQDLTVSTDGAKTAWRWIFGDGDESAQANPTHIYTSSGAKTVSLEVTTEFGCVGSKAVGSAIQVQGPKAAFDVSSAVFCQVPATVGFTNKSTGDAPLTYEWAFDDGGASTDKDPTHTYQQIKLFHPALTVKDKNGCSSKKTGEVRTGGEGGLTVVPLKTRVCAGELVGFSVTSDAPISSYAWSFGNNTFSNQADPTVAYSTGATYTVTLSAQIIGKSCASTVSFPVEVLADPKPTFTYSATCDYKVTFTNTSTGASRVQWTLDNGFTTGLNTFSRTYPGPGAYAVKLIAYNGLDCPKVLEQTITVAAKPTASFTPNKEQDCAELSLSGCAPFTVNFVNTSAGTFSSSWNFGDNTSTTTKSPSHTYGVGSYTVSLEIKNTLGCTSKVTAKVTVSNVTPTAKFVVPKTVGCAKEALNFTDQSIDATFWCWDFGDGQKSNAQNPTHAYEEPGVYDVTLVAKNAGCTSTFTITKAVTIKDPFVDFEFIKSCGDPYSVSLVNLSTNYNSLDWDFGDNTTATGSVGSHTYQDRGSYSITLTGKNNTTQCVVRVQKQVKIYDIDAKFTPDILKPCKGAPVTFTDESDDAVGWTWLFGDGNGDTRKNPTKSYDPPAGAPVPYIYTVTLIAADPDGCTATKQMSIEVLNISGNFSFTGESDCENLEVKFTDLSTANPPVDDWSWDFGDGSTADTQHPNHTYLHSRPEPYAVTLTLTNAEGTCSFIKKDAVKFTVPDLRFEANKPGNCMNAPIQFTNYTVNAQTYAWDFGDGEQTSTDTHPRVAYEATGSYSVILKATDQFGCEKTLTRPQYISITKPVAAFTARGTHAECPPLNPSFEDKSTGDVASWSWDSGDGQNSVLPSPAFSYLRPGEFDVTLTVTDANGCTDATVSQRLIYVGGPDGTFSLQSPGPFCLNDSITFVAETTNAVTHRWDFGDGLVIDQAEMNAGHRYKQMGTFHLGLQLIDAHDCLVVAKGLVELQIQDTAKVDFRFSPCIFTGEESSFVVEPTQDDLTFTWTVDGEELGNGKEMPAVIKAPGNHQVILTAVNQQGCDSKIVYDVPVQGDVDFVPNVFTPNGFDNLNSVFEVVGLEKSAWDLKVFNRWGEPVFEQHDYKNDWNAAGLSTGVYYYLLQNEVCPGREYKGVVSVIR